MSGIGGVVNAEFRVNATQAAMELQGLVRRFDAVEKAVSAASKNLNAHGASSSAVEKAHAQLAKQLERSTGAVKVSEKEWVKYAATLYTIHNVASLLGRGIKAAYDAAAEGAKIQAAQQFFANAGKSIDNYRAATNGMISDAELMKKANLADSMGIDEKTFKKLVVVAEASALKTGQSFDHMFNSIIVGTARSSRLLLDNLGIIVSVEQANQKYAAASLAASGATDQSTAAVNKFIEAMSAEQKQLAFVQEVAEKSKGTIDEYNAIVDKTAQNFAKMEAETQNAADAIKMALTNSFTEALGPLTQLTQGITELANELGRMNATPVAAGGLIGALLGFAAMGPLGALLGGVGGVSVGLGAGMDAQDKADAERAKLEQQQAEALRSMEEAARNLNITGNLIQRALGTPPDELKAMASAMNQLKNGEGAFGHTAQKQLATFVNQAAEFKRLNDILGRPFKVILAKPEGGAGGTKPSGGTGSGNKGKGFDDKLRAGELATQLADAAETADNLKKAKQLESNVNSITDALEKAAGVMSESQIDKIVADMEKDMDKVRADAAQLPEDVQKIIEDMRQAAVDAARQIADAITSIGSVVVSGVEGALSVFTTLFQGGDVFAAAGDAIAATVSAMAEATRSTISALAESLSAATMGASLIVGAVANLFVTIAEKVIAAGAQNFGALAQTTENASTKQAQLQGGTAVIMETFAPLFDGFVNGISRMMTAVMRFYTIFEPAVTALGGLFSFFGGIMEGVFNIFAAFMIVLSPLISAFEGIYWVVGKIGEAFSWATNFLIDGALMFVNFITEMIRKIPGLGEFGKIMTREELFAPFDPVEEATEDNTEAIKQNTAALKDFVREFRNMPANFKAEGYIFDSQQDGRINRGLGGASISPGMGNNNQRNRT